EGRSGGRASSRPKGVVVSGVPGRPPIRLAPHGQPRLEVGRRRVAGGLSKARPRISVVSLDPVLEAVARLLVCSAMVLARTGGTRTAAQRCQEACQPLGGPGWIVGGIAVAEQIGELVRIPHQVVILSGHKHAAPPPLAVLGPGCSNRRPVWPPRAVARRVRVGETGGPRLGVREVAAPGAEQR